MPKILLDKSLDFWKTKNMPARKKAKTARKSTNTTSRSVKRSTSNSEISYDTQMIVTVLLLIFVYPLGVIFMWAWMRNWPVWLKIIITLPVFMFLLCIFFIMFVLRRAVDNANYRTWVIMQQQNRNQMQKQATPPSNLKYY